MKKKILGLAIVALSMVSFTTMAQTPDGVPSPEKKECQAPGKECKGPKKDCKGKGKDCKAKQGRGQRDPFAGLSLTDAQKQQLSDLKARRDSMRAQKAQAARADRQHKDSVDMSQRRADRQQYLAEVKTILGPDQYVVYLENLVLDSPQQGRQAHQGDNRGIRADKHQKHFAKDAKADKGGKQKAKADKGSKHDKDAKADKSGKKDRK